MVDYTLDSLHKQVDVIVTVLDARDPYTFEHSERVATISELMANNLNLDKKWGRITHLAAHLHDIGKIGIPDYILNKDGPLSSTEYEIMKSHSRIGYNIVKKIDQLNETALYILHHHERWDGSGYPLGLSGTQIPLGARIIAIADTFDALTSNRSYRESLSYTEAFKEIERVRGTQLCPECVDIFLSLKELIISELEEVNRKINHSVFKNEENSLLARSRIN